jgi:hypothetical protein
MRLSAGTRLGPYEILAPSSINVRLAAVRRLAHELESVALKVQNAWALGTG